jgi:hypothetical protein
MTDKEAMKLALFALDIVKIHYTQSRHVNEAIAALKERLAQRTEQEPVAWAKFLHYPECWDTAAYSTLHDAIHEALAWSGCSVCTPPAQLAQRTEQNFCSRCGKRTKDLTHIHTCTPPPREGT